MTDVTIGDLELGDNPGDGDLFEVEQGGQSKRLTFAQIRAAAFGGTTLPVGAHRHWRIFIEEAGPSGSSWFARINELRFRKDEADLTLDGTASASAEGHVNNPASTAFDGDGSTVWASTETGPAWLAYSFSEAVEVDEISLKAGDSQARADDMPTVFLVEFSDDGKNWTSVQSYTTSPWAVDETRLFDVPASHLVRYVPEAPEEGIGFVRKDKGWAPEKTVAGLQHSAALSETDRLTLSQAGYASGEYWRVLVHRNVEGSSSDLYITEIQFREQEGVPQSRVDESRRGYNVTSIYPTANAFDGKLTNEARQHSAGAPFGVGLSRSVPWTVREIAIYYPSLPPYQSGRLSPGTFDIQVSSDGENWATVASVEGFVPSTIGWHTFSTASPAVERSASLSQLTDFLAEITSPSTQSVTPVTAGRPLSANDAGSYLLADNPADILLTVPDDAALNLPVGADITIEQHNDGLVELAPASGVALNVATGFGLKTGGKYAVVSLKKVADNTWTLFGNLEVLP